MDDEGESAASTTSGGHKGLAVLVAFVAILTVGAVVVNLLFSSTVAALMLAWMFFLLVVLFVFAIVPYYAIGFLSYRHR